MRSPLVRWLYALLLAVVIAGCSGGGCGGCAGGAIQPIRGGFALTPERRIPHAIQVRLTEQGLRSVEAIAPGLFGSFLGTGIMIPRQAGNSSGFNYVLCGSGCTINAELATEARDTRRGLELTFAPTDQIAAKVRIRAAGMIPVTGCASLGCSADCTGTFCLRLSATIDINTMRGSRSYIGLATNIALRRDSHAERQNYIKAELLSPTGSGDLIQEAAGEGIENEDINCTNSGLCFIVNLLRGVIIGQVRGQLSAAVAPLQDALAHSSMPSPPGCPTGTRADGDRCRYADNSLVPLLLGTDGQGNLGALLSSVTAGVRAQNSFLIAAGDPDHGAEVSTSGLTLNMFGAVESDGHNTCVPRLDRPVLPAIPEFMALRQNMVPGTTTPMQLGLGVSETFLNSALWNLWDSGTFCLGVTSRLAQQLSATFLGALPPLSTLKIVTFPGSNRAAAAIVLRPERPPTARIGRGTNVMTDPLLTLTFERLSLDFYAWSEERYVRFMTVTTNLSVPLNLMQEGATLRPVLGNVALTMTTTSNTQLLSGNITQLGSTLEMLLGSIVGMFAGSIPPVNLPGIPIPGPGGGTVGNITIELPEGGVAGVEEGSDRFLGLFANLQYTPSGTGGMLRIGADATVEAEVLPFDRGVYEFNDSFRGEQLPRVRVRGNVAMNPEGRDVEYSYRVDRMTWSPWTRDSYTDLSPTSFLTQGVHTVEARARFAGDVSSTDNTPALTHVTIDTVAPTVRLDREGDRITAAATDEVSNAEQFEYRWVIDGEERAWSREATITVSDAVASWSVSVRDANGNVSSTVSGSRDPLIIRGGPSTDAGGGCSCSTPGTGRTSNTAALWGTGGLLFALAMVLRRRSQERSARVQLEARSSSKARRAARVMPWVGALTASAIALGACGGVNTTGDGGRDAGATETGPTCSTGSVACGGRCVMTPTCTCPRGQAAMGMPALNTMSCMYDTSAGAMACNCQDLPPLPQGMAGSHLDMAVGADNSVWLSAYSAGDAYAAKPYGDLIVGKWNMAMSRVDWVHVDGVPAMGEVTGLISGWRGGVGTPGDDVGRWNSIRLTSMNQPRVAYWNTTADRLQFASSDNGTTWTTSVIDASGKAGRYASMVMLSGNIPAVAYRATTREADGSVRARVRFARANNANPRAATDWTVTEVASAPSQCRANDCNMGEVCVQETGRCVAPSGTCATACAAGEACIGGMCKETYTATWVEDFPPGTGLHVSLAADAMGNLGMVFYDRDRGNLMGARQMGSMWQTFIIDGEDAMMHDQGDRGAWSTLAIGSDGVWHVAYIDGWDERLLYTRVMDGARMGEPEVVDAGNGIGMMDFTDGRHIVGDSASVEVTTSGVRIAYQDSSAGTLRLATRAGMGTWTTSVTDMMGHTGYWARIRNGQIATFWRDLQNRDRTKAFGVRVLRAP